MSRWTVFPMGENLWNFHEEAPATPVDAYLLRGRDAALLVDALEGAQGVYEEARKLVGELPLSLARTHGHGDHAGPAVEEFLAAGCPVYLAAEDLPLVEGRGFPQGALRNLEEGQVFPLGGASLRVRRLPGHTPGSVGFLEERLGLAFTGDSVGSGPIWLQLPHSLPLSAFEESAAGLLEELSHWPQVRIHPGHREQSPEPLGLEYLEDVVETVRLVRSGQLRGEAQTMTVGQQAIPFAVVQHGKMSGFFYNPSRLDG